MAATKYARLLLAGERFVDDGVIYTVKEDAEDDGQACVSVPVVGDEQPFIFGYNARVRLRPLLVAPANRDKRLERVKRTVVVRVPAKVIRRNDDPKAKRRRWLFQ